MTPSDRAAKLNRLKVERDRNLQLLLSVAGMFYLYRKFEKSLSVLSLAEHLFPNDQSILEFRIVLLAELRDYARVIDTIDELAKHSKQLPDELKKLRHQAARIAA